MKKIIIILCLFLITSLSACSNNQNNNNADNVEESPSNKTEEVVDSSPKDAPSIDKQLLDADLVDEGYAEYENGRYNEFKLEFNNDNYIQVDEEVMSALQKLIDAGSNNDKEKAFEYVALEETWKPIVEKAHEQLGDPGDNEIFWTIWNDAIIKITIHEYDGTRGKDYYNVVCMDYKEKNGSAFRIGYEFGIDTKEYNQDFGYSTTSEYNLNEPMLFDYEYNCPQFPEYNQKVNDLEKPIVKM